MKIINMAFHTVFSQLGQEDSRVHEAKRSQVLVGYKGVLEVEVDQHVFTAQNEINSQKIDEDTVRRIVEILKRDIVNQVSDYVFRNGLDNLEVTHPDLPGSPTKYEGIVIVENGWYGASFTFTEAFKKISNEEFVPRVAHQLQSQIMKQIEQKLFEGWEI